MPQKLRKIKRMWSAHKAASVAHTTHAIGHGGYPLNGPGYKEYVAGRMDHLEHDRTLGLTWFANHYGYTIVAGSIHDATADVMVMLERGNFVFSAEFEPDTPEHWQVPEAQRPPEREGARTPTLHDRENGVAQKRRRVIHVGRADRQAGD